MYMNQAKLSKSARFPGQIALVAVLITTSTILIVGWHRLLLVGIAFNNDYVSWTLAGVVTLVAVIMARSVASERIRIAEDKATGKLSRDFTWLAYFVILFSLSAMGTLNTFLYYGEGSVIIGEAIETTLDCLSELQAIGTRVTKYPAYESLRVKVNEAFGSWSREASNDRNYGEGPVAKQLMANLTSILPGLHPLSGACYKPDCVNRVIKRTEEGVNQAIVSTNEYRDGRILERELLKINLIKGIDGSIESLGKLKLSPEGSQNINSARQSLESAWTIYDKLSGQIKSFEPMKNSPICFEKRSQVRYLGALSQIFPMLIERRNKISTYIFLFAAMILDLIMIASFIRALGSTSKVVGSSAAQAGMPKFLWVDPTN
jgi:hypothetical protein